MKKIEIAVCSTVPLFREGIRQTLDRDRDYHTEAAPPDFDAILTWLRRRKVDVLLYDLKSASAGDMKVLKDAKEQLPGMKIVLLVGDCSNELLAQAVGWGVEGYILRNCSLDQLVRAVHAVVEGEICLSPKLLNGMIRNGGKPLVEKSPIWPSSSPLTSREVEIGELVSQGLSNREVADRLSISESTVKAHLNEVFRKLKVTRRLQLALHIRDSRLAS